MALTFTSTNENRTFFNDNNDNGQVNSQLNSGITKTTSTLTPTLLKNIQERFLNHSLLPPEPFLHNHMARFVPPMVNISLHVKPQNNNNNNNKSQIQLDDQSFINKSISYSSSNSNSNDSYTNPFSEDSNSENSSLVFARKSFTFKNSIENNNNSDHLPETVLNIQNNSEKMKTRSKSAGISATTKSSNSSSTTSSSSNNRTSQQKKSNSGGRKPNSSQNLTPEEVLKRQKRRERNKLAAARCRKKRVDQTNNLIGETKELQKEYESLVKDVKARLEDFHNYKNILDTHTEHDLNANTIGNASSSQDEFPPQPNEQPPLPPPPKRKRPNSLTFRPMNEMKTVQIQEVIPQTSTSETNNNNNNNNNNNVTNINKNLLPTPNSFFNDLQFESTGLTPLNPTLTSVDLTPSTMSAFLKSITSPTEDERKKLLSM